MQKKLFIIIFSCIFSNIWGQDITFHHLTTDDGLTKSAIIDISNETYIITENIKLQKDSFFNFSNLSKFKGCIFNTLEDEIILEKLKNYDLIIM